MRKLVINAVVFVLAALPGPAETSRSDTSPPHAFPPSTIVNEVPRVNALPKSNASPQTKPAKARKFVLDTAGEVGVASWYGEEFDGRPTANGEIFDKDRLSAAHPLLPLGTWIEVTNLSNHRSLVLRINDRGPYIDGRVVDVSEGAAKRLGFLAAGVAPVEIHVVENLGNTSMLHTGSPVSNTR